MNVIASLKKVIASFSVTALLLAGLTLSANAQGLGFTDDAEIPSWANEAIEELMFQGVLSGNDDGSFAPARALNRAEVAKIIVLATGVSCDAPSSPSFPDVQPGDWFFDYVECMANYGWINGYPDGMFRPAVTINRAEMAKMVINAFGVDQNLDGAPHFTDVSSDDWFYGYVETAYNNGIMQAYTATTFSPASLVTRAETARIVYDAQLYIYNDWEPTFSDGGLTVSLSPDTPAGTNIPFNATSVPYTTVAFSASSDADVEMGRVTFTRLGLGDNDDFDNCWMEFDGFKVGNEKSVTTDDTVELSFNPPIVIPAGQTLVGDIVCSSEYNNTVNTGSSVASLDDRNIGHRNRFAIVGPEDILSTAVSIVGNFPIEGEEMETSDYAVSELEFQDLGSNTTIEVGDEFAEIGKFRLLNDSATGKDLEIRAMTFENECNIDMANVLFDTGLYVSGDQISFETIIDGDYITFRLDDGVTGGYILEDGDSRVFTVRSDIVTAENGDCIQLKLDNYEDVVAVEIGTAFGVRTVDENGDDAEDANATLALYNIDSGDLNISRDSSNPGNEEYSPGSNEVVAQVIRAVVGQPMEFDGITFHVTAGSTVSDKDGDSVMNEVNDFNETFDNFRLYIDDQLIDNEDNIVVRSGGSDGIVTDYIVEFNTNFELSGTSIMRLVLDIEDDAMTGDQIKFEVSAPGLDFDNPEYIATGDNVPGSELLGVATGSFVEVELSQLIITKTDGFSNNDNIVAGEDDVNVLEFTLTNNESGDVNITSVTVGGFGTGSGAVCANYTLALFLEGVQVGSSRTMNSNCTATFNDISGIIIPSGEEKEFTLVVNTIEASAGTSTTATSIVSPLTGLRLAKDINPSSGFNSTPDYACVDMGSNPISTLSVGAMITLDSGNTALEEFRMIEQFGVMNAAGFGVFSTPAAPSYPTVNYDCRDAAGNIPVSTTSGGVIAAILVEQVNTATAGFGTANPFPWNKQHLLSNNSMVTVGFTYPAPTSPYTLYVSNAAAFSVGQAITVTGLTSTSGSLCISNINTGVMPNTIDVVDCTTGGLLSFTGGGVTIGGAVTLVGSANTIAFGVVAVEADNVENGQEVITYENSYALTDPINEAVTGNNSENCDNGTVPLTNPNYLCGVIFNLVPNGRLTVTSGGTTIFSDILLADETDVEVMQIRFNAAYDEIHVTDLYLENDVYAGTVTPATAGSCLGTYLGDPICQSDGGDPTLGAYNGETANNTQPVGANAFDYSYASERFDFKLYASDGTLLDTAQMQADGTLHFNLGNTSRVVVPKDDSETVSVKVNVRDINAPLETGHRLRLSLDTDGMAYKGVEAVTAATGDDIDVNSAIQGGQWETIPGIVSSQDFVAYRTEMMVSHAAQQVQTINPSAASQEIYRFTVAADGAHEVYVGRLTFDITTSGFMRGAAMVGSTPVATDFVLYEVDNTGLPDTSTPIADGTGALPDGSVIDATAYGTARTAVGAPAAAATGDQFRLTMDLAPLTGGVVINAGSSKTYAIYMANTTDNGLSATPATDDYATVTIERDDFYGAPYNHPTQMAVGAAHPSLISQAVVWSDAADPSHSPATVDWLNGYRLDIDTNALPVGEY